MQTHNPQTLPPLPSEEAPLPKKEAEDDSIADEQLLSDLIKIVLSADFPTEGELSFKDEIKALRAALACLQESFSQAVDLDQQLKLTYAISHLTSSLSRLVRAQNYLRQHQPSPLDAALERAIQDILKEWGWT